MTKQEILELAMELAEEDAGEGICLACGEIAGGCEPDARGCECESCGKRRVFGAEEVVLMLGGF